MWKYSSLIPAPDEKAYPQLRVTSKPCVQAQHLHFAEFSYDYLNFLINEYLQKW